MILACPTCDGRYDVSGYAVGQQLRCRCGTVMTRPAEKNQAGLLACPHCGGGVSPTSNTCEYCSASLLLKQCPRCLSRVFSGHKHCPECGAEIDLAAEGTERKDLPCPRCSTSLTARLVGDIVIDECDKCLGLFLDQVAIQRVITDRAKSRAEALMGTLPRAEVQRTVKPGERMYVKCPCCAQMMNRKLFAAGAGVIVDVCRTHGTFFDAGELPQIIEFVMKGGLEQAQKKELERERQRLDREKANLAHSSAVFSAVDVSHVQVHNSSGSALVDLLFSLFG